MEEAMGITQLQVISAFSKKIKIYSEPYAQE
jgi:hypothetical protein